MSAHQNSILAPGPDLLARYLSAYLRARPARSFGEPWGVGGEGLDGLWFRLLVALSEGPRNLSRVVAEELNAAEKACIAETLAPLIFALPLRSYPAELRSTKAGPWLMLTLRHLRAGAAAPSLCPGWKHSERNGVENVGYLPAALSTALASYVRRVLRWPVSRRSGTVAISSGGRRRQVRIMLYARGGGIVIRFLKQLPPPPDE